MENRLDEFRDILKSTLNAARFLHTLGVCEAAAALAERFGADREKAVLAALLHDCARGLNAGQIKAYCEENGIALDGHMKTDINPVHALIGADMAKKRFGIIDEEVLAAIERHAVGCESMTLLDKIIFVADAVEPNRDGEDVDEARRAAENDLDGAAVLALRIKTAYLRSAGRPLHPDSVRMLDRLGRVD